VRGRGGKEWRLRCGLPSPQTPRAASSLSPARTERRARGLGRAAGRVQRRRGGGERAGGPRAALSDGGRGVADAPATSSSSSSRGADEAEGGQDDRGSTNDHAWRPRTARVGGRRPGEGRGRSARERRARRRSPSRAEPSRPQAPGRHRHRPHELRRLCAHRGAWGVRAASGQGGPGGPACTRGGGGGGVGRGRGRGRRGGSEGAVGSRGGP
jgi:translation initiation factor IF-2